MCKVLAINFVTSVILFATQTCAFGPTAFTTRKPLARNVQGQERTTGTASSSTTLFVQSTLGSAGENSTLFSPSSYAKDATEMFIPAEPLTDDLFLSQDVPTSHLSAIQEEATNAQPSILDKLLSGYMAPRVLLAAISCFYATNFPLGTIMADAMPAPAVTSARMVLASLALSPFLFKIEPSLRLPAIFCGCFTAMGYVAQSLALVDTSPATVSFLGAATVLVCPFLEWAIDKKPMSLQAAPQRWLAAILCVFGVGALELWNPATGSLAISSSVGMGDAFALLQAVGFGTQIYFCEKMIRDKPEQALPVTATLVATTALIACIWSFLDGWMALPGSQAFTLPQLFFEPSLQTVAAAVVWTGLVSTSLSFFVEVSALGRVPSSEASIILATEPMWAALFAATVLGENFGMNDYVGGAMIVLACLANSLKPAHFEGFFGELKEET